jgi:hypothetical protein
MDAISDRRRKHGIAATAQSYGWDSWLKVREDVELAVRTSTR